MKWEQQKTKNLTRFHVHRVDIEKKNAFFLCRSKKKTLHENHNTLFDAPPENDKFMLLEHGLIVSFCKILKWRWHPDPVEMIIHFLKTKIKKNDGSDAVATWTVSTTTDKDWRQPVDRWCDSDKLYCFCLAKDLLRAFFHSSYHPIMKFILGNSSAVWSVPVPLRERERKKIMNKKNEEQKRKLNMDPTKKSRFLMLLSVWILCVGAQKKTVRWHIKLVSFTRVN